MDQHSPTPAAKPTMRTLALRILRRIGVFLAVLYLAACGVLYTSQTSLIYPRSQIEPAPSESERPPEFESFWITAKDGSKVEAWFLLGEGRSPTSPGPAAVLTHGNGEYIDYNVETAKMYRRWGISVLMPEYRGYGRSTGTPGQAAITEDLLAFYSWLVARPEVDASRLVYHGESIGTGYACVLADAHPPRALILNSPFMSLAAMAARYGMPSWLVESPLRNDQVVSKDIAPVLIFHGSHDTVVPFEQGKRLSKVAPRCEFVEFNCGHNDLPPQPDWPVYAATIHRFLAVNGVLEATP